ncbi:MAG: hypothetical protein KOO63_14895 [Bacteroidales bacterium]|nr:hypothetical protein [Candidatus Latescibacterota bacterium]
MASAVASPLMLFSNLQLRPVMASDTDGDYAFGEYFALRLTMLPLALIAVSIVAQFGYTDAQMKVIILFAIAKAFEGVSDIFYGYAQKNERMELIARSLIIKGVASLVLFGTTFAISNSLSWALIAMAAGWAIPLFAFDIPGCRRLMRQIEGRVSLRPKWRITRLRSLAYLALPLGLTMLLIQLRNTIPRTILESQHGEAQLGIFSAMAYLVIAGNTVVMALSQSSIARLSRFRTNSKDFTSLVKRLLLIGFSLGAGGVLVAWLVGQPLLTLIYSEEYATHHTVFILIMAAGGLLYMASLLGAPATAMKAYREQMWIQAINVVWMLFLARWLIPGQGMMGAAWTMVGGSAWVLLAYGVVVWRGCSSGESEPESGEKEPRP